CHGSGTFQLGVDSVHLSATVADYDGETLSFDWTEGPVNYGHGVQPTTLGGAPTDLSPMDVPTGTSAGALGLGTHFLNLAISDNVPSPVSCNSTVQVIDTQAPTLAPTSNVRMLWPPNHQMVDIVIQANAHDSSGAPVSLSATVASSEDPLKNGSGNTVPDYT